MPPSPGPARRRPDVELFTEIGIIQQLSNAALERALPDGLSAAGFGVLSHFVRLGREESPAQLAKAFQVTKGAMTNTLQRLEAAGLVAIRGDEADGRRKLVSLTPAGAAAYEDGLVRLKPRMDGLRSAFSEAEFEAALPFLRALRGWLDQNR
jgi:DNA-binding MarR family transcriptional regulator